ncbi:hypothetical protein ACFLQ4_01565 [Bacteroidota bacterium]
MNKPIIVSQPVCSRQVGNNKRSVIPAKAGISITGIDSQSSLPTGRQVGNDRMVL